MKNSLHPYALIFGIGFAIIVFAVLRHPLFALFAGVGSVVGLDMAFKSGRLGKSNKNIDSDKTDK